MREAVFAYRHDRLRIALAAVCRCCQRNTRENILSIPPRRRIVEIALARTDQRRIPNDHLIHIVRRRRWPVIRIAAAFIPRGRSTDRTHAAAALESIYLASS